MRRAGLAIVGVIVAWIAVGAPAAAEEPAQTVLAWARGEAAGSCLNVQWRLDMQKPPPGLRPSRELYTTEFTRARWPDHLYRETRLSMPASAPDDVVGANARAVLMVSGLNRNEAITPDGYRCLLLDKNEFLSRSGDPSLRESALILGRDSPFFIAHWILENDPLGARLVAELTADGGIHAVVHSESVSFDLFPGEGGWMMTALTFLDPSGAPIWGYTFDDFRSVSGAPGPVAFRRRRYQVNQDTQERTDDQVAVLEHRSAPAWIADEGFQVDLTGATTVNPRTGAITNSDGALVGVASIRQRVSPFAQWAVTAACAFIGMGFALAAAFYLRRVHHRQP